jgi:hypothetical protein
MSNPSGLAMTLGNSASSLQKASMNSIAVMTTLMTNLRMTNLSIASPDRLTSLPTELLQQVASNLSPCSVMALRSTNKAAAAKTFTNFVETCLRSMTIHTTKVGVQQALKHLQTNGANKATTHVTFIPHATDNLGSTLCAGIPSQADLQTLLAQLPNAASITIRDGSEHGLGMNGYRMCLALTATSTHLTGLTLDGCALPGSTLLQLLSTHSGTLRYVALRNVQLLTTGTPFKTTLTMLATDCSLDRLVLDTLSEGDAETMSFISDQALNAQEYQPTTSHAHGLADPASLSSTPWPHNLLQ